MKSFVTLASFLLLAVMSSAQTPASTPAPQPAAPAAKLTSDVYVWDKLPVTPNAKGMRRAVLDGPTTTLDKLHCHITTLNPGEKSGEPTLHLQEEIIIVKEGTMGATSDGVSRVAPAGSVIFFAAHSMTWMRNIGTTP